MVCLGNICRSPLAEGILRSKLPYENFVIDSAGTSSYHIGSNPDNRSITVGNKYGIDISKLMGRQFSVNDFNDFDIIYAMDASNYNDILHLARNEKDKNKVKMILNEIYPNQNYDIPDPYHGGTHGFENIYKMLDEACNVIVEKLKQHLSV